MESRGSVVLGVVAAALLGLGGRSADAAAAADLVCAKCHPGETERYLAMPMGKSIGAPVAAPDGQVTHALSRALVRISSRDGHMFHAIAEAGLTAERPVRYQIGAGMMGRGYLVQTGDTLFESPVSWFNNAGWDISPGYQGARSIDFDRPVDSSCLFCHAGAARFKDADGRQLSVDAIGPISCDRCHGPGQMHAARPSARNIVNPARLSAAARNSICEQCHLEGLARVLNPGKAWTDFHPGEVSERTFIAYVPAGDAAGGGMAVSHFEQLAQSACARGSAGKMWCGTCHQPHGDNTGGASAMRKVCVSCHPALSPEAHPAAQKDCTSCHMPRRATSDIEHAAITDHRILRRPSEGSGGKPTALVAWRKPAGEVERRDLGLAEVFVGVSKRIPELRDDGFRILESLPERDRDPDVLSALAGWYLQQQRMDDALKLARRASELRPESAKAAMNLGIVLKRSDHGEEAERELNRAISLDPLLRQAYVEIAELKFAAGDRDGAVAAIDRYLKCSPQDIFFRLQRARLAGAR